MSRTHNEAASAGLQYGIWGAAKRVALYLGVSMGLLTQSGLAPVGIFPIR